ncbi:MAG: glycosyltransferase [Pseudomonadota bacterium]
MARILITCTGLFSNLASSVALAHALREAGHEVSFAAPETATGEIGHGGFKHFAIQAPQLSIRGTYLPRPKKRSGAVREARAKEASKIIASDGIATALEAVRPDLVLSDCEHHSAILQALGRGHRVATLSFMYFTPIGPGAPPLTHATVPGRGMRGSALGQRLGLTGFRLAKRISTLGAAWKGCGAELTPAHRQLALDLQIDLDAVTSADRFQAPWSYTLPNLLLLAPEVDMPTEPAPGQTFVGPMILRDRARQVDAPKGSYFSEAPGKRIFAGFGSILHPPLRFLKALDAAVETNPDWHLLVATSHPDLAALGRVSDRVTIASWVPQLEALDRADCALFHGGAGTLNECLRTATPMIVYPNALDGAGNGARVVLHGLGEVGTMKEDAGTIGARVGRVLADDAALERLQALAVTHSDASASARAVRAVELLIS